MQVTFLETRRISPDGFRVIRYQRGETYNLDGYALRTALNNGWAKEAI